MEAKLKISEFDCYKCSFSETLRKEEARDAVVPDTMPDIAEVLCCWGTILIRSKDVSAGRLRVEANIPAGVLCRAEDGSLRHVEVNVPVFLSVESEKISDAAVACARLKLLEMEARTLNPRKILVRAEISAELSCYESGKFVCTEGVEGEEHIHAHLRERVISLPTAVGEKSFAVNDDIALPPAAEGAKSVFCAGCECVVDETKTVGTKLIVKGRVKSRLVLPEEDGTLRHLEPGTDFSQIIELGCEAGEGFRQVWIIPSGAYCSITQENEGRITLEYHLVAQHVCYGDKKLLLMDKAYSNLYELEPQFAETETECICEVSPVRENLRQLFETMRSLGEVLWGGVKCGKAVFEGEKMLLPLSFTVLCTGADGIWCERRSTQLSFRVPDWGKERCLKSVEPGELVILPVPGGMEVRMETLAHIYTVEREKVCHVSSLCYDEDCPIDNSEKPSLVLLRPEEGEELWEIARENCSCEDAILAANGMEDPSEAIGRLILIPKIC